ncbi:PD-(D/E)XK nuclease family protein [Rhizobium aouanii]|uniref:PD-(D/E)XK nuclease family protein n=1 Tax=Rhizobium aouanii TaxID=3118145 RepID=A0ABU8CNL6_9HYPH
MQLIFGLAADGRVYPDAHDAAGSLDKDIVGPLGLVQTLETQLGMLAPNVPKALRIATYLAKLRACKGNRFWTSSFSKDPWSTAAAILEWRDTLVGGGWSGTAIGSPRVDDLAAVEAIDPALPAGLEDRAIALLDVLTTRPGLRICQIGLVDRRDLLSPLWARMVEALEAVGVTIFDHEQAELAIDGSDLRIVQRVLSGEPIQPLAGDGTFTMVEADTELMAAETVADWLAAGPPEDLQGTVILASDGDTALLDHALRARGVPALGLSESSPWRGALQVIPLVFAAAWRPFDPRVLLNLFLLPRPPVAAWVARRLARALSEEPGVGGRIWQDAWAQIENRLLEINTQSDPDTARRKTDTTLADWRAWTEVGRFERGEGIPLAEAMAICGRVAAWAIRTGGGEGDRLLRAVSNAAATLSDALGRLELSVIPALLLERVVVQVLSEGVPNPDHIAEAGAVRGIKAPGALWSSAQRVIWWNFVGPGEKIAATPWDNAEREALIAKGVEIDASPVIARRIEAGHSGVIRRAHESVILVRPALARDEQTTLHPMAHRLRPLVKESGSAISFKAERLLREPNAVLADRILARQLSERQVLPPARIPVWTIPSGTTRLADMRRESATSLTRMLNCQLSWFAQDILNLRPGRFAQIPGTDQLFGNLAHEIARRLLLPGTPPAEASIRTAAVEHFESLLPEIAAPLLQPEHAGELAAAREMVPRALEALVRLLHAQDLEIVGSELDREAVQGQLLLQGRLDLLVRRDDRIAVLDLKWTRSERRYREQVASGRAIQLAVYRGLSADDGTGAPGGYFLLRQRRIVAGPGSILTGNPIEADIDDLATLGHVTNDWRLWHDLATNGTLIAAGFPDTGDLRPVGLAIEAVKEPCRFCNLRGLCRVYQELV